MATEKENGGARSLSSALDDAQSIIAAAEQRAKDLLENAETTYQSSVEKGYEEGFEQGRREATEQAVRLIEESTAIGDKLAEEAAKLAIAITETIVGSHVEVKSKTATEIAIRAIQDAVVGESVTIVAHPKDIATLKKSLKKLEQIANGATVALDPDEELARGGCIVRTDFGEVDSSITMLVECIASRLGVGAKKK